MGILTVILYALVVVTGLLLIGLILIQPSKGGGMGSAFGGVGESVLGAHAGSHLTKATVWLTSIFFVISLVLATLIGHGYRGSDELSDISAGVKKDAAAKAAAPADVKTAVDNAQKNVKAAVDNARKDTKAVADAVKKDAKAAVDNVKTAADNVGKDVKTAADSVKKDVKTAVPTAPEKK